MLKNTVTIIISQMGTTKGNCLGNSRIAASPDIPAKYKTAWEAEQHCILHAGAPPLGVWTPAFFSYYATINGVYKNWGHVGWHSPDGKFYSDGVVYASISAYEAHHAPHYVGWGELLNDVRVVQYVADHIETVKPVMWNVRSTNSLSGFILGQVHGGERYNTVIVVDNWRKITFNGKTGYVSPKAW